MAMKQTWTESGLVEGIAASNQKISVFRGIPFAAAPVGILRWREPRAPLSWKGIRECHHFAPAAMQMADSAASGIVASEFYLPDMKKSEDCLYLNIWTPAESMEENLPVAVYIHGGGFAKGFSYNNAYDGEGFSKRGIILVTITYRTNIFGFLTHPQLTAEQGGTSGNYGLKDQVAALEWVKRNIKNFGGDPDNVTVFGQSAGAASISYLLTAPAAQGLFHRAIMQSGGGMKPPVNEWGRCLQSGEKLGIKFFEYMGWKNLDEARKADAQTILEGFGQYIKIPLLQDEPDGVGGFMRFAPVIDGTFLEESPMDMCRKGAYPELDYMLGSTSGEWRALTCLNLAWGENAIRWKRKPAYIYYFDRVPPGAAKAHHSSEHHYIFQTLMRSNRGYTGDDFDLSNELADRWAAFIKTGNPNMDGMVNWTPYTQENRKLFWIQDSCGMKPFEVTQTEEKQVNLLLEGKIRSGGFR